MGKSILEFCREKGILLDKELFELLQGVEDTGAVMKMIEQITHAFKERVITKAFFSRNIEKIQRVCEGEQKVLEHIIIRLGVTMEFMRERPAYEASPQGLPGLPRGLKILSSVTLPAQKLDVDHFVRYFRSRFQEMKSMLQSRQELQNLVSINKLSGYKLSSIIGMVVAKRVTKNKNLLVDIEDLNGRITFLVQRNREVYEKARDLMLDDVIGVRGTANGDLFFANEVVYPDAFLQEKHFLEREEFAAFTSDVHVGSKMFLKERFLHFLDWLNGKVGDDKQKEMALKVKWLFITGDAIDGVGVYPGQEVLLETKDIREQYQELARMLSLLRKDITIILCPGQHDAVRVAEPQPPVGRDYADALHQLENVVLVSNPAVVEIVNGSKPGVKVMMYHGASMHSFISEIEELRIARAHHTPARVVKQLLKRRHLAPTHSSVTYIPGTQDALLIREIPDIITTGDLHRPDIDYYNNILIVASSCWQSITPFEEKVGNSPDPCKVPIVNLKTRAVKILDFSGDERAG